jgi:formate dehydrogenase major subunit
VRDFIIPTDDRDMGTPAKVGAPVSLTIDGIDVTVPEGTSVMRAAAEAGIQVPKLCATDSVEAFGSCRLCVVEIEGRRGTPASCTTPVAEGMVVHTQAEKVKKVRRGVMELYISDHPLDCLTCAANGDCELQDMAGAVGLRDVRYEAPPEARSPTISRRGTPQVRRTPSGSRRTTRTPISPMIHRNASSAAAACGPARRCRGPLR